jgi:hypothetical protein
MCEYKGSANSDCQFKIATDSNGNNYEALFALSALTNCYKTPLQIGLQSSRTAGTYLRFDNQVAKLGGSNGRKLRERHFEFELGPGEGPCSSSR